MESMEGAKKVMRSPFEGLAADHGLVCEFFATFARFEYAMKGSNYCTSDRWDNAVPDWQKLQRDLGPRLENVPGGDLTDVMKLLLGSPPRIQKFQNGHPDFVEVPLNGGSDGAKALEAAKRVRNNLFHGGKHGRHATPDRDTQLVAASLQLLLRCLELDNDLRGVYEP